MRCSIDFGGGTTTFLSVFYIYFFFFWSCELYARSCNIAHVQNRKENLFRGWMLVVSKHLMMPCLIKGAGEHSILKWMIQTSLEPYIWPCRNSFIITCLNQSYFHLIILRLYMKMEHPYYCIYMHSKVIQCAEPNIVVIGLFSIMTCWRNDTYTGYCIDVLNLLPYDVP